MVVGGRVARVSAESTYYYSTHLVAARVDGVVLLLLLYAAPAPATAATAATATTATAAATATATSSPLGCAASCCRKV